MDAIRRGYDCLKVKVGADPTLDVARLAAVRKAVGDDVCIRIDANQAWSVSFRGQMCMSTFDFSGGSQCPVGFERPGRGRFLDVYSIGMRMCFTQLCGTNTRAGQFLPLFLH